MTDINAIMQSLAEYRILKEQCNEQIETLTDSLKQIMIETGTNVLTGSEHVASWKERHRPQTDYAELKKHYPGIVAEFTTTKTSKYFTFK